MMSKNNNIQAGSGHVLRFSLILVIILPVIACGGWLYGGIDIATAVLIGWAVVSFNFFGSALAVIRLSGVRGFRVIIAVLWMLKMGLTGFVLYGSLVYWDVNLVGLIIGLSAIVLAVVIFVMVSNRENWYLGS